jgi:hypothetical protein
MNRALKFAVPILAIGFALAVTPRAAHAQFGGGGDGGFQQMEQFAPMLEMMKKKLGKKRFAKLMQTMGPMMSNMMDGQGGGGFGNFGDMMNGGGFGNFGGGNFDMNSMSAMMNPEMISTMVSMFDGGSVRHGRRSKRHVQ